MREKNFGNIISNKDQENFNLHLKYCLKGGALADYYLVEAYK